MTLRPLKKLFDLIKDKAKYLLLILGFGMVSMVTALIAGKIYQNWDDEPDRGAIAMGQDQMGESYSTPVYLEQGWDEADSLWFYNTTQGSNLIPYDLFMALELAEEQTLFRADKVSDQYRYLPQKKSFFNPDALAVGFTKDEYQGKDYIGYTCAACHTGQVNYQGNAIRIDGGPAMADMVGYLTTMQKAMQKTLIDSAKQERFVKAVLDRNNDYGNKEEVIEDLEKWTKVIINYNAVNHSSVEYGYARLDAFGRIYNRVLQHVINKKQAKIMMLIATNTDGSRMLTETQVDTVLKDVNSTIIGNQQFALVLDRLMSDKEGYPNLTLEQMLRLREYLFNEPNAPVSYPFLWDITHSDYVQWNGLADNSGVGPLGRNAGEVTGVFATLDWKASDKNFNLAAKISGQNNKKKKINFKSSIDLINLERLEGHLKSLRSPLWPEEILGKIDTEKAMRGQLLYEEYCQSCHMVIDRKNWDRIVIAHLSSLEDVGTDPQMAKNSVEYQGKTGNFKFTYQATGVGNMVFDSDAPVAAILTATTKGVVATPDADKWIVRRWLDWVYTLGSSFFDNNIKASIKQGTYKPDTTAKPFNSLLSYKARSLNGIWATAPYLHNGSVPSLYELLLPAKRDDDPDEGLYRPTKFTIGGREFDPIKVGFISEGYNGFTFDTKFKGNLNHGHEYAAGRTPQPNGETLPALNDTQRWELVEFLKTL